MPQVKAVPQVNTPCWLRPPPYYIASMSTLLIIVIVLAVAATAFALVKGVLAMASGKDISGVKQQKMMRQRVFFQGAAVVFVALFLYMSRGGN